MFIKEFFEKLGNNYRINEFKKIIKETNLELRQFSGLIIASSFSMMILLLTFIKERNLLLEIGISSLLLSIILQYSFYERSNKDLTINPQGKLSDYFEEYVKQSIKNGYYLSFGEFTFFTGMMFILFFFNLPILSILIISYLIYINIKRLKAGKKALKYASQIDECPNVQQDLWKVFKQCVIRWMRHAIIISVVILITIFIIVFFMFYYPLFFGL